MDEKIERLLSIVDLSGTLGVSVGTFTAGATEARGPRATASVKTSATGAPASRPGSPRAPTSVADKTLAYIERRRLTQGTVSGKSRSVVHDKVRYRDTTGKQHSETKTRLVDAERRESRGRNCPGRRNMA